jgi:hypothetical protein
MTSFRDIIAACRCIGSTATDINAVCPDTGYSTAAVVSDRILYSSRENTEYRISDLQQLH